MSEVIEQERRRKPRYGGGPKGLGDPDDLFLRKVEKDVMIPKIVRERSRLEKCVAEVKEFTDCCKENGLLLAFKCRAENAKLKECLTKWFHDDDFRKECTQQYLDERSQYRRTGIPKEKTKHLQ
ncbi:hypothetical protein KM043_016022 [Ampulex compressa]|nr:hypothetical protein KM043_016022 [Ampulex compressa]